MKPRKVEKIRKLPQESDESRRDRELAEQQQEFLDAVRFIDDDAVKKHKPPEYEREQHLDRTPAKKVKADIIENIDLHGYTSETALEYLSAVLDGLPRNGRHVLIVVGKGTHTPDGVGILRQVVPKWLDTIGRNYVSDWRWAKRKNGGGGAIVARLRQR
jgi:DNA-nicking Smr family endonuclease